MGYLMLSEQRVPINHGAYYMVDSRYDIFNGFYTFSSILFKTLLILLIAACICVAIDCICKKYRKYKLDMEIIDKRLTSLEEEMSAIKGTHDDSNSNDESIYEEIENGFVCDENGDVSDEDISDEDVSDEDVSDEDISENKIEE